MRECVKIARELLKEHTKLGGSRRWERLLLLSVVSLKSLVFWSDIKEELRSESFKYPSSLLHQLRICRYCFRDLNSLSSSSSRNRSIRSSSECRWLWLCLKYLPSLRSASTWVAHLLAKVLLGKVALWRGRPVNLTIAVIRVFPSLSVLAMNAAI